VNEDRLGRWVSILANSGVLIGLLFVLLQMNQNEELLRIQILNQYHDSYVAQESSFAGENLPTIWQKAAEEPQDLSLAEMRAMESQTFAPMLRWINLYQLAEAGIVDEAFWRGQVRLDAGFFFGTPYGRAWWERQRDQFSEEFLPRELREAIDKVVFDPEVSLPIDMFRSIQERAVELTEVEGQ
jgi:hypothetical protein